MYRIAVELHGIPLGALHGDARSFDFLPDPEAVERFGDGSTALSVAVPLTERPRRHHAERRRNWFRELLAEGDQYRNLLRHGDLPTDDAPAFLSRYGGDLPGAVTLRHPDETAAPELRAVDSAEVRRLLDDPVGSPLANAPTAGKSSLGGVQPKIVLARTADGWAQALGGHATTHLLKPRLDGDETSVIFDEEYGTRLARRLGLADHATTLEEFDGLPTLVVERYDRDGSERVHQEDFNQALGASRNQKYQEIGGVVSLQRIATTIQRHCPDEDLTRLARMVVLAVAVGNLDMHAKNIALVHEIDGPVRLAPAYDVVPHAHRPNDGRLALAVNRVYSHATVTARDLAAEFASWGLRRGARLIDDTLEEIAALLEEETPHPQAAPDLREDLRRFVANLRGGGPAGEPNR
ncbi:MAG: HipA domain-containing protein [Aeromicrobium sp.]|uniref:type II toxin-antitoxin system HipA family toxin n=1 Tax=Aeromicrobium sp. TaxID=1871063 RepID=UPI0039E65552